MAFRASSTVVKTEAENLLHMLNPRRWTHAAALPSPLNNAITHRDRVESSFSIPEFHRGLESPPRIEFPSFSIGGSMELMAVPKKKVSRHKRGIRNGPKALKPIPVIVRCRCCGRVKLPHFFCCSGDREAVGERSDSTN